MEGLSLDKMLTHRKLGRKDISHILSNIYIAYSANRDQRMRQVVADKRLKTMENR